MSVFAENRIVLFVVMVMSDLAINSAFFLVDSNNCYIHGKKPNESQANVQKCSQLFNNEFAC